MESLRKFLLTALLTGLSVLFPPPARAQIDWRADTVWTQLYLKGENAHKDGKYSQATGWLMQAVERAEGFGPFDERLTKTLRLLQQVYVDARKEEEADAVAARLAAIDAARPETAVERHTRQSARIRELEAQSAERLNAADYRSAEALVRDALSVADSIPAFDRAIRADLLTTLAAALKESGDPATAERLFLVTLAYRLNDDNRSADAAIGTTIESLAQLHRQHGDEDRARRFDKTSRTITADTDWRDFRDVQEALWETLHQAGEIALSEGRLADAQELLIAARHQGTRIGPDDQRVGRSLDALGRVQWRSGTPQGAEPLFRQSAAILMRALGNKDPLTALPLIHLGRLAQAAGRLPLTDTTFSDAIEVLKRKKERGDTTLGTLQHDLAAISSELGDPRRAENLYRDALKTDEKLLGKDHPNVARDAYGLAMHYLRHGKPDKAERHFQQAIAVAENALGRDNPVLAAYLTGYADSLRALARDADAEEGMRRAESIMEKSGAGSP